MGGELLRGQRLLGVDLLLQLGRPVVRVDEPVDVLAEPQPEEQIPFRGRHTSNNAACP